MKKNRDILSVRNKGEKVLYVFVFILFLLYAISLIYPFVWLLITSLKTNIQYRLDIADFKPFALPEIPQFKNFIDAFTEFDYYGTNFGGMFFNSIWYTLIATFNGVFASCLTGYCIAKYKFKLRGLLYGIAIFSMTIPVLGATAAVFKLVSSMGIYDTPLYVVLTTFGGFSFNFLVMYGFFQNVSWTYAEAVFIDGGGHFTAFFKVMLPQAIGPISTLFIITGIQHWNEYEAPILYMPHYPTVSSGLYFLENDLMRGGATIYFAALFLAVLPILIIFIIFSDKIMKNVSVGGIK